ncbi:MAG: group III truncated hemoglobin [Flavobacteriales bacterium]|tara:strand:+ start:267 stop:641 length:375 start_codon:yes stop_codon:yes gene_type:complete
MKKEIENLEDIKLLVNGFYDSVRKDELLSPIFNKIIVDKWPEHLEKMYRFWQSILLEEYTYSGNPFLAHANLGISEIHFKRWLNLFYETLDSSFEGEIAEKAKLQGEQMSKIFSAKIEFIRRGR